MASYWLGHLGPRYSPRTVCQSVARGTLTDILNAPCNFCFTFHASQLKCFVPNDPGLFLGRELSRDRPVTLPNGQEEHVIKEILDDQRRGKGWQYLVRWKGYGPGDDEWMPRQEIEKTVTEGRGGLTQGVN